ncbi:class I SAM-dependent methyltransferase [Chromobacterium amazonense]|uniref:class I SAM-dependent methyltransferase n=1 Tax=Chromobacterium amazonense TaxID=1382803 RepID=UPI0031F60F5E
MKQFDLHAEAYNIVRGKIAYPEKLFQTLSAACSGHEAALDIGCGNGVSTIRLADYFSHVEGVDLGENLIEKAKANYPALRFSASPAEQFQAERRYDLITSATSFYWMDRQAVLGKMGQWLKDGGVFCAYKYDFPVVYGPLRNFIERELVTKWAKHRDDRLVNYDNTLELIQASGVFSSAERHVVSNIIELSPREVALFFLSTSYVTRYMDQEGGAGYVDTFIRAVEEIDRGDAVKVNFDIHAFIGRR